MRHAFVPIHCIRRLKRPRPAGQVGAIGRRRLTFQRNEESSIFPEPERLSVKLIYGNDYYDKIQQLVDGQVRVEGIEISPVFCPANELFLLVLKSSEFDLAEMSLTSFLVARSNVSDFP